MQVRRHLWFSRSSWNFPFTLTADHYEQSLMLSRYRASSLLTSTSTVWASLLSRNHNSHPSGWWLTWPDRHFQRSSSVKQIHVRALQYAEGRFVWHSCLWCNLGAKMRSCIYFAVILLQTSSLKFWPTFLLYYNTENKVTPWKLN